MIRLMLLLALAAVATLDAGQAFAQGTFPAPLPGQTEAPASNSAPTASPAFGGASPPQSDGPLEACTKGFAPLREEAEKRGKLIKAASDRKAPPHEACKLIGDFGQAELKMIKYVETNSAKCGIPPRIAEQLRTGHKNTEAMQKICMIAQQGPSTGPYPNEVLGRRAPPGPVGDFPPW